MPKIIDLQIGGIKCDACDWHNDDIDVKNYGYWINRRCPKCDSVVLTLRDYHTVLRMISVQNWLNKWFGWIGYFHRNKELPLRGEFQMNGTGKAKFVAKEK